MDLNPLVLSVLRLFIILQKGLYNAQRNLWEGQGLSSRSLTILTLIDRGLDRPQMLADYYDILPSTISFEINKLIKAGLVERVPGATDLRTVILTPTAAGVERNQQMKESVNAYVLDRIRSLDPGEFARFIATARKLATADESTRLLLGEFVPADIADHA